MRALNKLESLNSNDKLDAASLKTAEKFIAILSLNNIKPSRIVKTAENGVAIWRVLNGCKIHMLMCEDEIIVVTDYSTNPPSIIEFAEMDAVISHINHCET